MCMRLNVVVVLHMSTRCQCVAIHKQGPQIINYDRYRGVSARARAPSVSAYVRVCTPWLKSLSHSRFCPNGTAGEQKLDYVACAILTQLAASEGLSVITAFPLFIQQLYSRCGTSYTLFYYDYYYYFNDMDKYSLLSVFYTPAVVFISLFWTVPRSFYVSSLVFEQFHWLINQDNNVFILMTLVVDTGRVFMSSFCPYLTNWYSLQCHSNATLTDQL